MLYKSCFWHFWDGVPYLGKWVSQWAHLEPAPLCQFLGEETIIQYFSYFKKACLPSISYIIISIPKKTVWGEVAKWVVELPAWGREIPNKQITAEPQKTGLDTSLW